jgi:coxsackievirus/adenovirus receptor
VPDLNKAVCDGETSRDRPCDNLCGGAGCGKCGGLSCQQGALTRAQEALQNAKAAEKIFAKKDLDAEGMLNKVSSVHADVTRAAEEAQTAFDLAAEAKNRSKSEMERVEVLSTRINAFLNDDKATPEQVKSVAYECLNATMKMDTSQIQGLAEQINEAIGQRCHSFPPYLLCTMSLNTYCMGLFVPCNRSVKLFLLLQLL